MKERCFHYFWKYDNYQVLLLLEGDKRNIFGLPLPPVSASFPSPISGLKPI
jgi:hypothetical protein